MSKIAIVGMSCRLPRANNTQEFWELLSNHQQAYSEVPKSRWDWRDYYSDEREDNLIPYKNAGFIDNLEYFDGDFFGMDSDEVERLDPQQRVILELVWEALENASILPSSLSGSDTAVLMGVGHSDHARRLKNDFPTFNGLVGPHSYDCFVSNRVSYLLNLKGPSFVVNSACSSSLHAVHLACGMLRNEETDLAICGGVNVNLLADETVDSTIAKWLSPTGECQSFSEGGKGFIRSEGGGVVILKRLEDALGCGDPILGVICGSALAHNGLSNGISVPNGEAQQRLIKKCFKNANLTGADIDYIEAHGTGSSKGDSTEALSLIQALSEFGDDSEILIGCCKANIGHTESASGVAGLIKILLSLQHEKLLRISNLKRLNRWIPNSPLFTPLTNDRLWPRGEKTRRAGLANFAFGGSNTFFIIEEHVAQQEAAQQRGNINFVCLSAKSLNVLDKITQLYMACFPNLSPDDRYSLNCYREKYPYRNVIYQEHETHDLSVLGKRNLKAIAVFDETHLMHRAKSLIQYFGESQYLKPLFRSFNQLIAIEPHQLASESQALVRYIACFWHYLCHQFGVIISSYHCSTQLQYLSAIRSGSYASSDIAQWVYTGEYNQQSPALTRAKRSGKLLNPDKRNPPQSASLLRFDPLAIVGELGDSASSLVVDVKQSDNRIKRGLIELYLSGQNTNFEEILTGKRVAMLPTEMFNRQYSWFSPTVRIVKGEVTNEGS